MDSYTRKIIDTLRKGANPENAGPMSAYMKNQFDFLGIKSPERRESLRPLLIRKVLPPRERLWQIVHELWNQTEREFQYAAMELASKYNRQVDKDWIDRYEYMITNKSWWDTVDFIAATLAGNYFKKYPEMIPPVTRRWMQSDNIWLQRSCLLFQLKYKNDTDTSLLSSLILPLSDSREFFIAKAIGWSLREYSKTDPGWVKKFVSQHELRPLSKKEALKVIKAKNHRFNLD